MAKVTITETGNLSKIMHSDHLSDQIEAIARPAFDAAKQDPDQAYTRTLRFYRHDSQGRAGRVSWRIGAHPVIGPRVEAKRGTLARAAARIGA